MLFTPLTKAAFLKDINAVKALLDRGDDVNEKDDSGATAMFWASMNNQTEMMRLLIERGATFEEKDKTGNTPMSWARHNKNGQAVQMFKNASKLHKQQAKEKEKAEKTRLTEEWLLAQDTSALSAAIASGSCRKVRKILDDAFWRNKPVTVGWEHLKIALEREDKPMLRLLIARGADGSAEKLPSLTPEQLALLHQCGLQQQPAVAVRTDKPKALTR